MVSVVYGLSGGRGCRSGAGAGKLLLEWCSQSGLKQGGGGGGMVGAAGKTCRVGLLRQTPLRSYRSRGQEQRETGRAKAQGREE